MVTVEANLYPFNSKNEEHIGAEGAKLLLVVLSGKSPRKTWGLSCTLKSFGSPGISTIH